ncbi:protein WVD2-like 6 isoform X1 [Salvia hispanica]|uniref:protein WVD2-like 6 isoform X1 n=1 Tax=Salvia hispanica TaxID=49212 RepID=UPI0020091740|nr:protein WVD2-like 6 isoform X1 [Salvia hispanica]XP_047950472.1 protein WVD2-like 6 isoform X1 [Salvia hispanica]XP_047950473.1 protein WVD2-like 6 isoform X1 [Salvia hispanica]
MMAANPVCGAELENGLHEPLVISENVIGTSNGNLGIEEISVNLEEAVKLEDHFSVSDKEIIQEPVMQPECHSTVTAEAPGVKGSSDPKNLKPQKVTGKAKSGKSLSPKPVSLAGLSKSIDGKKVPKSSVASNGTISSESVRGKTPALKTKAKSFNEREASDSLKATNVQTVSKQQRHPVAMTSSTSETLPEDPTEEETKAKVVKKGPANKAEENSESSLPSDDGKPRKLGTLPAYDFNFKCDERAEKRREFYTKLEEKIHAKEMEKNNLQAKTKESQEAEIKMLRKKLGFKATPMPSFYQEPAPPKLELKKIPTTRAKSPKLGRKKTSSTAELEENDAPIARPSRMSLDVKFSKGNVAKTPPPVALVKKPLRKSLPRLPSETSTLSGERKKAIAQKTPASKEAAESRRDMSEAASAQKQEGETGAEANGSEMCMENNEAALESQEQDSLVHEPIAV